MDPQSRSPRLHPRVPVTFPVVVVCSYMGKSRIEQAQALDLSPGGIGIHTEARLRLEQPVSVEFTLPIENMPLKVEARIRHSIDGRYGLSFIHLSSEQTRALERIVH